MRLREEWEYIPTPEHKVLVLTLYRNILKGLLNFKSTRKRSVILYARLTFRKRAKVTEKLLIDECIEEARRNILLLGKMDLFTKTGEYMMDSTGLPKDTGQDVKSYMEEMYDPEVSKQYLMATQDVVPGREDEHAGRFTPKLSETEIHKKFENVTGFSERVEEALKERRPPPPPASM